MKFGLVQKALLILAVAAGSFGFTNSALALRIKHVQSGRFLNVESACTADINKTVNIRADNNTCNLQSWSFLNTNPGKLISLQYVGSLCLNTVNGSVGQTTFLYYCSSCDLGQMFFQPSNVNGQFYLRFYKNGNLVQVGQCLKPDSNNEASLVRVVQCDYSAAGQSMLWQGQ
jgi:hypothetical protein